MSRLGAGLLAAAVLSACATLPPARQPALPAAWAVAPAGSPPQADAWRLFGDAALEQWIGQVHAGNAELAAALARIDAAGAALQGERAGHAPSLHAVLEGERRKLSRHDRGPDPEEGPPPARPRNRIAAGLNLGYELDLRGRIGAAVRAAESEHAASRFEQQALTLTLARHTALLWFARSEAQARIGLGERRLAALQALLLQERARQRAGLASGISVGAREAALAEAQAGQPLQQARLQRIEHALCHLAGQAPQHCRLPAGRPLADLQPAAPGAGLPAELLSRRPDLCAAAAGYDAARARLSEAEAARWPSLTLGGSFGFSAAKPSGLSHRSAGGWAILPQLDLPVFDAGRRRAEVSRQQALLREQFARWQAVVGQAVLEVEDAGAALAAGIRQEQASREEQAASERQLRAAARQVAAGRASGEASANATLASLDAEGRWLDARLGRLQAAADLVAALGGGWAGGESSPARQSTTP